MKIFKALVTAAALFLVDVCKVTASPLQPVDHVDLSRYAGHWYEIAALPQSFQLGCKCTTAAYNLRDDGAVDVVNSCRRLGIRTAAEGRATVVDSSSNARLSVDFGRGDPGSYVVIGLDDDYRWAVVSSDDQRALWVLARERSLDAASLGQAIEAAARQVELTGLKFTDQRECE